MPSRDGYGLSEGRSRCDKKTAKGNTSGNAVSFHWRKAIDEVDKEELIRFAYLATRPSLGWDRSAK